MATLSATPLVNEAVAEAKSLPALITNLEAINPDLATQLTSKPLLASKTPWGTVAAGLIGYVSARYGLGLDETTTSLIAGVCVLLGSYAMRLVTKQPVAGVVSTPLTINQDGTPVANKLGAFLAIGLGLGALTGCAAALPIAVEVAQDVTAAYGVYQAGLGLAQQASAVSEQVKGQVANIQAQAVPVIAAVKAGAKDPATAQQLANLSAQLVAVGAPYITVTPNVPVQVAQ